MGSVFQRVRAYCATCKRRPSGTACEAAGHKLRERKSKRWYIQYKSGDRLVTEYTKFKYQVDAENRLADIEGEIRKGARPGKLTFDDAMQMVIDDYEIKEHRSLDLLNSRIAKHLKPVFGGQQMSEVTTDRVRSYNADRKRAGAKSGTIRNELAIVSRAFTLAVQQGLLLAKPHIPKPPASDPREGFFTDEEFDRLSKALPEYLRPIASFLRITGWRLQEALGLTWDRVDEHEVRAEPRHTKNKRPKKFPITKDLAKLLGKHRKAGPVFPDPETGEAVVRWRWRYAWDAAREASKVDRIAHDLRRTAVRRMTRAGIPDLVAMKMTGHKTRRIFDAYNIGADADLEDARKLLDRTTAQSTAQNKGRKRKARKQAVK